MVDGLRADGHKPRVIQYAHGTLRAAVEHAMREELVSRQRRQQGKTEGPQRCCDPSELPRPARARRDSNP
jgi:hypothetical protein